MNRDVEVGIVDVLSGKYETFNKDNMTAESVVDVMYASFGFPGFFPPVEAFGSQYFDGSAMWSIDIPSAINKCLERVSDPADVVVDVVMTSSATISNVDTSNFNSIHMLFRFLEIGVFYDVMDGIMRARFAYPQVTWRYAVTPSTRLPFSLSPLNLNTTEMTDMMELGESDAKNVIALGPGVSFDNIYHYFSLKKTNDKKLRSMTFEDFVTAKQRGEFEEHNYHEDP
jgi:hypothetical protein